MSGEKNSGVVIGAITSVDVSNQVYINLFTSRRESGSRLGGGTLARILNET